MKEKEKHYIPAMLVIKAAFSTQQSLLMEKEKMLEQLRIPMEMWFPL